MVPTGLHHLPGHEGKRRDRQERGGPVAAVQDVHRVLVLAAADEEHGHDGRQQAEAADDEREEDPRLGIRPAELGGDPPHGDAQDHGADVLGGRRLEQVGATAGAVADVVAHQVGDHGRVARVVLGDAGLHLADQVGADVGRLGVDTAAELGEEGHEAGAEAEADDQERRLLGVREAAEGGEDAVHAEQRERHHQEAGDGAAAHGDLHRSHQAVLRRRGGAQVGLDADVHADDARRHRAGGTDQEGDAGADAELEAEDVGVGDLAALDQR